MAAKNNKGKRPDARRSETQDMFAKLKGLGVAVNEPVKKEEPENNKYANYDPEKERQQGKGKNRGGYGNGTSSGSSSRGGRYGNNGGYGAGRAGSGNTSMSQKKGSGKLVLAYDIPKGKTAPHAPYNFVRINHNVLAADGFINHNVISDKHSYSGFISYEVTAETPIIIDDGSGNFYQTRDKEYAIPGSSMRGLIRNNFQILSFSGFRDEIDDYNLMYRAVTGGCLQKQYGAVLGEKCITQNGQQMTVLNNVKAGYIGRTGQKYYIYKHAGDSDGSFKAGEANYYVLNERHVIENNADNFRDILRYFQNQNLGQQSFKKEVKNSRVHYKGRENKQYKPYEKQITYKLSEKGKVCGIAEKAFSKTGYVLSSGTMNEKKAFYVIPEIDRENYMEVPEASILAYQADYNRKKTALKNKEFYELPEDGRIRPVFYIELGGKLYFGYTPRLRLMFEHTILEGLKQKEGVTDYTKTIFGYSKGAESYKSKVSFTDAVLMNGKRSMECVGVVLGEPKPTSYLEYVTQKDGTPVKTYNDDDFTLRGVKQYWIKKSVTIPEKGNNEKVLSKFSPLESGSKFAGKIRFYNLTQEELGLLLWSIRLESNCYMNIGKAKSYGYGNIRVDHIELHLQNSEKAYSADLDAFSVNPYERQSREQRDAFVDAYKDRLAVWLGVPTRADVLKHETIRDFMNMKSALQTGETASYMKLEEYKNHKRDNYILPSVEQICKK